MKSELQRAKGDGLAESLSKQLQQLYKSSKKENIWSNTTKCSSWICSIKIIPFKRNVMTVKFGKKIKFNKTMLMANWSTWRIAFSSSGSSFFATRPSSEGLSLENEWTSNSANWTMLTIKKVKGKKEKEETLAALPFPSSTDDACIWCKDPKLRGDLDQ